MVAAREATGWQLLRFWTVTLVGNLAGGWALTWLIVLGFPQLRAQAMNLGAHFATASLSPQTFSLTVLAGSVLTLLTRMQTGTDNDLAKIVAAIAAAVLIAGLGMFHSVLDSLLIFSGIHAGGTYSYGQWAVWFSWTLLGNLLGGVGLTTLLRLVRSFHRLTEWRSATPARTSH